MAIEPKSGYQPRPAAAPSAGRALSVLVAACAVLWVWWMLPAWLLFDPAAQLRTGAGWYGSTSMLALIGAANMAVHWHATRPMWRGTRPTLAADTKRAFVLTLCLLFHLLTPAFGVLLQVALALAD